MRSGGIDLEYGFLRKAGSLSDYWSVSGAVSTKARHFNFNVSVSPSSGAIVRYIGYSLRCLQE